MNQGKSFQFSTSGKERGFGLTFPRAIFSLTFLLMVDDGPPVVAITKKT
jgi:hypothetical protein